MAKNARHQMVSGGGISMYLPNDPDVLTQSMAMLSSSRWRKCGFSKKINFYMSQLYTGQ